VKILLFGATGTVGGGVLRQCLQAPDVEEVLVVTRRATGVRHPRLREVRHEDFTDFSAVEDRFAAYDVCFWCVGRASRELDEAEYTRVTHDFAVAAGRAIVAVRPDMAFFYVSVTGADTGKRAKGFRVKARAEKAIQELFPTTGCMVRPAHVQPADRSSVARYTLGYRMAVRLYPLLDRALPHLVTTSDRLGQVMLQAARTGVPDRVLEGRDLR
jgi:uncharacterized protein YbjT (DUF2867 family)